MNIELELTLRCNAKCHSCSRHAHYGLYDDKSDVTLAQIAAFIVEVQNHGNVDLISVMGGEPTVHPEFPAIVFLLKQKLLCEGHVRRMQIVTNGSNPIPDIIKDVPVTTSPEHVKSKDHRCMFAAPCDTGQELKECSVPKDCGISFGAYGYWPCGAGGAIARLFGLLEYNRQAIPNDEYDFPDKIKLCVLCQAKAKNYIFVKDFGDIKSVSFRKAFKKFDAGKLWKY